MYFGCTIQYMALLQYHAAKEISTILSVGTSYLNIVVKDVVFTLRRNDLQELWHRLGAADFKAKTINEFR